MAQGIPNQIRRIVRSSGYIAYENYIIVLEESQKTNLSQEKLTKSNIDSMQKSLEMQFEYLQKMKTIFSLASKSN
jgi:hypothetical protein